MNRLCKCGCGLPVNNKRSKYIGSHWQKSPEGRKFFSENHWYFRVPDANKKIKAIRKFRKNRPLTQEQKDKIGKANTKYNFEYTKMFPELAYVVGAFLSDGNIYNKESTLELSVTDKEFIDKFVECIKVIQPNQYINIRKKEPIGKQKKLLYRVGISNKKLCSWMLKETNHKTNFPSDIFTSDAECKVELLNGLFDGDGSARKSGSVYIATSNNWIFDTQTLLKSIGVVCSSIKIQQILPNGKPYRIIDIGKDSFSNSALSFSIPRKQNRII